MCNSTLCSGDASAAPNRTPVSSTSSDEVSIAKRSCCKWCLYASASEAARRQRGARGRKARDRALAVVASDACSIKTFKFVFKGALSLRVNPATDSAHAGKFLYEGEVFQVSAVVNGETGQRFLRLADGRGWAFALHPSNGTVVAAEIESKETAAEAASEQCLCRFHSANSKGVPKSGILPSYSPCFYWIVPYLSWWKAGA